MSCIAPVEALLALDPNSIPCENESDFLTFGNQSIDIAFNFYGNPAEDIYQGHRTFSPALLNCTNESLKLEYGGYKNYVNSRKAAVCKDLQANVKSLETRLLNANAQKYKSQSDIKVIESQLSEAKKKTSFPITALELLSDNVLESAFPNIRRLLSLYVLIPQSEAVVERGFSRMKTIMTDKRTNLDPKSLEALMRISHNPEPLTNDEVIAVINIWKSDRRRRIFSSDI